MSAIIDKTPREYYIPKYNHVVRYTLAKINPNSTIWNVCYYYRDIGRPAFAFDSNKDRPLFLYGDYPDNFTLDQLVEINREFPDELAFFNSELNEEQLEYLRKNGIEPEVLSYDK